MAIGDRIKHAWNAFLGLEARNDFSFANGPMSFGAERPDRQRRVITGNERTIISSIYSRIGIDVAALDILHVRLDDEKRYLEDIDSGLNTCLTVEANIDQAARQFR